MTLCQQYKLYYNYLSNFTRESSRQSFQEVEALLDVRLT